MKIYLLIFSVVLGCSNPDKKSESKQPTFFQKDCGCVDDFKTGIALNETKMVLVKNFVIRKENGQEYIEGNCAEAIRMYIVNEEGHEIEEEEVSCISKNKVAIKLSDSTQYSFYVTESEPITGANAKNYLLTVLKNDPKAILNIEFTPEEKIALLVTKVYFPE